MKISSLKKLIISQKRIIELIQILVGTAIMGVAIGMFLLPNQLSSGGFTGIATIIFYLFKLPVGTVVLILNVPLFIWAFFKIGRNFFIKGVAELYYYLILLSILGILIHLQMIGF